VALEEISVSSLRNSLNACKNSIDYGETSGIISSLSSDNIWDATAKNKLKSALNKLINDKYSKLNSEISNCLSAVNLISSYQDLYDKNQTLQQQIINLKPDLYDWEVRTVEEKDRDGQIIIKRYQRKVKNDWVESQIEKKEDEIRKNKLGMQNYKKRLDELILGGQ